METRSARSKCCTRRATRLGIWLFTGQSGPFLFAGDAIATWPALGPGWPAFNLNPQQHKASLSRMARLDAHVVAVGHGEAPTFPGAPRGFKIAPCAPAKISKNIPIRPTQKGHEPKERQN